MKKLLIVTQAVDVHDPILGFFHTWIVEFSKNTDALTVLCLREGDHSLPRNVKVFSLGKKHTHEASILERLRYAARFFRYIIAFRNEYDSVLVHMNPEYIVLGGLLWRSMGKNIVLWYTHRQVNFKLRVATLFAHSILTAAKESFRLNTNKVHPIGHGIDVATFKEVFDANKVIKEPVNIISVGRISPIKNLDTLIEAVQEIVTSGISVKLYLIGAPAVSSDTKYLDMLQKMANIPELKNVVHFVGAVQPGEMSSWYGNGDILVNLTPTGGIDKAVLEAMASGVVPLTSNQAFALFFGKYKDALLFRERDVKSLVVAIRNIITSQHVSDIRTYLQTVVVKNGSVEGVVRKIGEYLWKNK